VVTVHDHLSDDDLRRFRSGAMPAAETAEVARHLAACADCARRGAESASRGVAPDWLAQAVAGEAEHPDDETIVAFVGGTLGGERRRAVDAHLRVCASCRREVAELREDVQRDARRWIRPLLAIAAVIVIVIGLAILLQHQTVPRQSPIAHAPHAPRRSPEAAAIVADALAGGLQRPAFFDDLRPRGDVPRQDVPHDRGGEVSLAPAGIVVETQTPQLTWSAQGRSYVVTILDGARVVERSGPLTERQWTPSRPLRRGITYEWQVEVHGATTRILPAPPAPPVFFRVVDAESLQRILDARQARPPDPLLLGIAYARAGMQREAEEQLARYVAQHPAEAGARRLLESIRRW
jgi:anti-sigma factor RsiW